MKIALALLTGTTLAASLAHAETTPIPVAAGECRVRQVRYTTDLITLHVPARGSTMVILSPQETSGDIAIANGQWKATTAGNTFVVVPTASAPATDLPVVTTLPDGTFRNYTFLLTVAPGGVELPTAPKSSDKLAANAAVSATDASAASPTPADCDRPDMPYATVKIVYPASMLPHAGRHGRLADADNPDPPGAASGVAPLNASMARRRCAFKWRGSPSLLPLSACDTGLQTTFYWSGQTRIPGIFMVQADGTEASVNPTPDPAIPGQIVVNGTSQFWVLRMGDKLVADLYDAAWNPVGTAPPPVPAPASGHLHCYHSRHYTGQHCYRDDGVLVQAERAP